MSFVIHCTKRLLERIKPAAIAAGGALGTEGRRWLTGYGSTALPGSGRGC